MSKQAILDAIADVILERMGPSYKHDLPAGFAASTNLIHGPVGIFGTPGLEPDIFGTRVNPSGLTQVLPAIPSVTTEPLVGYLTGFTADEAGNEQENPCDDPLEAGNLKSCIQYTAFGRIARKTSPLALVDLGTKINRGEMFDLRLVNDPLVTAGGFELPGLTTANQFNFNVEVVARLYALGVAFQNIICPMVYTGAIANNTGGNGYMEFVGLEGLVTTTHTDAITGTNCPSLASDVKDFNYLTVENDTAALLNALTYMWRYVNFNARTMNFGQVQWAWVMRSTLFSELVDVWPCAYATYRCNTASATSPNNTDAVEMRRMSEAMRTGSYLEIDGIRVPVIQDDCLPEDTNTTNANVPNPCFGSDIYLLPLTVTGGRPVTYFEFRNFQESVGPELIAANLGNIATISDGGRFLWYSQFENGCFSLASTIEPRLRLLTPHLAGRLQNVVYCPLQHFRDPLNDQPYFVNGGVQTRTNSPVLRN